jgi:glycosyltransferase involved in cell wall biosynthesis
MARSQPSVCICIPTFNAAATLRETLDSLVRQTYRNITFVIADNASTDDTIAIAQQYSRILPSLEIARNEKNIGEATFTRCIELGRGDYTAIYHADDVYEPDIVEREVAFLEKHRDAGAVLTGATYIDEQGRKFASHPLPAEICKYEEVLFDFPALLKSVLHHSNFLMCPSAMARTSVYQNDVRVWDVTRFPGAADLDVWLRIAQKHKLGVITAPLMRYRVSRHSYSFRYARTRTTPHIILPVLDHYVGKYRDDLLDAEDLKHYRLFFLRDHASRALNALINDDRKLARRLARNVFTEGRLATAVSTPRGLLYGFAGFATLLLSLVPIGRAGRRVLYRLKFG